MVRPRKLCEIPRGRGGPCSRTADGRRTVMLQGRRRTYNLCSYHLWYLTKGAKDG